MKNVVPFLSLLFCTCAVLAQPSQQVVVPNGMATIEGNSSTSDPFTSPSFRFQQVFDASQFAFLGSTGYAQIFSVGFRIDGASAGNVVYSFAGGAIQLSTTSRSADNLSSIFSENIGSDVVTIFNGGFGIGNLHNAGMMPQPFAQTISAVAPFFYFPQQGNLLLDITAGGGQVLFPGGLDVQSVTGDSVSRVFANSAGATIGTVDSLGLVTQFQFVAIPEPAVWHLVIAGLALIIALRRK